MRAVVGYLFALTCLSASAQVSSSVPADIAEKLDAKHLYLDAKLDKSENHPFAYSDFREAASHFADNCTLYIAPNVYWVDDLWCIRIVDPIDVGSDIECAAVSKMRSCLTEVGISVRMIFRLVEPGIEIEMVRIELFSNIGRHRRRHLCRGTEPHQCEQIAERCSHYFSL